MAPVPQPQGSPPAPSGSATPSPSFSPELDRQVYAELRALAARYLAGERAGHTLQPTALVHEAYLRLASSPAAEGRTRQEFIAIAATVMRRVLVDSARARRAAKRAGPDGGGHRIAIEHAELFARAPDSGAAGATEAVDLVALDSALRTLDAVSPRQARVVELRFFGGLSVEQAAELLGVSTRTVEVDWRTARAWLRRELEKPPTQDAEHQAPP
jgi:RNA polymerase sigma factor (TIGR02999 family)